MVLSFCRSFFGRHEQHSTDSGMYLHYYYKLIGSYPASLLSTSARKGKANNDWAYTKIFPINIGQDNASTMIVILLFPLSNMLLKRQTANTLYMYNVPYIDDN